MWSPTAAYLSSRIPQHSFAIVPLTFDEVKEAVRDRKVDFVITNSADYVSMETLYGASRILTLRNREDGSSYTRFGGVIFTRADRSGISDLADLKGKTFTAVGRSSFGGWLMAQRELKRSGIDPYRHFAAVRFSGTHDAVVKAVLSGAADAGTVRTGILERMAKEGRVALRDIRILNPRSSAGFPFLHSTMLYPEWPIAKMKDTTDEQAKAVALALLTMREESPAARAAGIAGWTIPLDYQPVHDCLRELKAGPYKELGTVSPADVLLAYWHWFAFAVAALVIMAATTIVVLRLNRQLRSSRAALERTRSTLELRVQERTDALEKANAELRQEIIERTLAEDALRKSEERYRDLFEHADDLIQCVAPDGRFQYVNEAWLRALGYRSEELRALTIFDVIHPDCHDHCSEIFRRILSGESFSSIEVTFVTKSGETIIVEGSVNCNLDDNKPVATRGIFRDVTERKMMEARLKELAERDPLTNILNRRKLYDLLDTEVQRALRYRKHLSLILFDIDDFKRVNDTFGHAEGDMVLITIASIVQGAIRKSDIFARFGGEEFIILAPETALDGAYELADKVRKAVESYLFPRIGRVTVSIGVAGYHGNDSTDSFIKRADDALYRAKGSGKNRIVSIAIS